MTSIPLIGRLEVNPSPCGLWSSVLPHTRAGAWRWTHHPVLCGLVSYPTLGPEPGGEPITQWSSVLPHTRAGAWRWTHHPVLCGPMSSPVKWSWIVHEWFLNSSCAVHEHLFMNSSWTIHEDEMAKFMKLVRFMNLEFISLSSWTCEFMNSSWTIVHDLFMNNFKKWYMNSSWIVHEHLFINSSGIVHE